MRLLTLIVITMLAVCAQSNQASISGVVTDQQGAAIPSAKVVAANTARRFEQRPPRTHRAFTQSPICP